MLLPIYEIDLIYFKRRIWFFNEKANKFKEEDKKITKEYSDSVVDRIFAFVVEVYNRDNPFYIDAFYDTLEKEGFEGDLLNLVEIEITNLREKIRSLGWDPRIKIKVAERSLASAVQILQYAMDLDETVKALNSEQKEIYETTVTDEDIVDNPSMEQMNDFFKTTKVLSAPVSTTGPDKL